MSINEFTNQSQFTKGKKYHVNQNDALLVIRKEAITKL